MSYPQLDNGGGQGTVALSSNTSSSASTPAPAPALQANVSSTVDLDTILRPSDREDQDFLQWCTAQEEKDGSDNLQNSVDHIERILQSRKGNAKEIWDIDPNALSSASDRRKHWYALALVVHPDKVQTCDNRELTESATEAFQMLEETRECIDNPAKYDASQWPENEEAAAADNRLRAQKAGSDYVQFYTETIKNILRVLMLQGENDGTKAILQKMNENIVAYNRQKGRHDNVGLFRDNLKVYYEKGRELTMQAQGATEEQKKNIITELQTLVTESSNLCTTLGLPTAIFAWRYKKPPQLPSQVSQRDQDQQDQGQQQQQGQGQQQSQGEQQQQGQGQQQDQGQQQQQGQGQQQSQGQQQGQGQQQNQGQQQQQGQGQQQSQDQQQQQQHQEQQQNNQLQQQNQQLSQSQHFEMEGLQYDRGSNRVSVDAARKNKTTLDGCKMIAASRVGEHGWSVLVQEGTANNPSYRFRTGGECGGRKILGKVFQQLPLLKDLSAQIIKREKACKDDSNFEDIRAIAQKGKDIYCLTRWRTGEEEWIARSKLISCVGCPELIDHEIGCSGGQIIPSSLRLFQSMQSSSTSALFGQRPAYLLPPPDIDPRIEQDILQNMPPIPSQAAPQAAPQTTPQTTAQATPQLAPQTAIQNPQSTQMITAMQAVDQQAAARQATARQAAAQFTAQLPYLNVPGHPELNFHAMNTMYHIMNGVQAGYINSRFKHRAFPIRGRLES